jgi:hypothetical protein
MSAFLVADKTINTVVNCLGRELEEVYGTLIIRQKLMELGIDPVILGHEMFQLNIRAVDARYGNGEARKFRPLDYRYEVTEPIPMVQVLKSLQCWLYQCNEKDIPTTALYGLFDNEVQLYLMNEIIDTLPEYQNAVWG